MREFPILARDPLRAQEPSVSPLQSTSGGAPEFYPSLCQGSFHFGEAPSFFAHTHLLSAYCLPGATRSATHYLIQCLQLYEADSAEISIL